MSIYDFINCCEYKMSFLADEIRICAPDFSAHYCRNPNTYDYEIPLEISSRYYIVAIIPDVVDEDTTILNIIAKRGE